MLIGYDFSPALAHADRGAYFPGWEATPGDPRALWRLVDEMAAGDPHLSVGGFVDHLEVARHFRRHGGRVGDRFEAGSGRLRVTERRLKVRKLASPYSCFNLVGAAQVGKASLAGMRMFHALDGAIPLWPFDPVPDRGPLLVEIYTGIAARAAGVGPGRTKIRDAAALDRALAGLDSVPHAAMARYDDHATDAIMTAAWLRRHATNAALWSPEHVPPEVLALEGWTFGVP